MNLLPQKLPLRTLCISLSLVVHLVLLCPLWKLGALDFAGPVAPRAVMVELTQERSGTGTPRPPAAGEGRAAPAEDGGGAEETPAGDAPAAGGTTPAREERGEPSVTEGAAAQPVPLPAARDASPGRTPTAPGVPSADLSELYRQPPERSAGEFLASAAEKLTYRISMFGTPMGSAELEARNEKGEVRITLKVQSDPLVSTFFPIDDLMESRLLKGNFIITRTRRQEGSFKSDRGFTIFLKERYVFWIDLLRKRVARESIPDGEVLDLMSALYYLRNRALQVEKTEKLKVFDGIAYREMPVEVLLRERVRLPGFREVTALKVRPLLQDPDLFNIKGDLLVWLSDDQFKVPVKVETRLGLGAVSAELLSAETTPAPSPEQHPPAPSPPARSSHP